MANLVTIDRARKNPVLASLATGVLDTLISVASLIVERNYSVPEGSVPEDLQEAVVQIMVLLHQRNSPFSEKLGDWSITNFSTGSSALPNIISFLLKPYELPARAMTVVEVDLDE
jgi:hypothetical protein